MADFRVLLTGFVPFGRHTFNASQAVVERVARTPLSGVALSTLVLPVVFEDAFARLASHLDALPADRQPQALVLTGMAARTRRVRLERLAVNLADAEAFAVPGRRPVMRPDNAGVAPVDRPIVPGAPLALGARSDVKALARELKARGLPVEVSLSAGSFVCNDLYYRTLDRLARASSGTACLFVHLPDKPRPRPIRVLGLPLPLVTRRSADGLSLSVQVRTVRALISTLAQNAPLAAFQGLR